MRGRERSLPPLESDFSRPFTDEELYERAAAERSAHERAATRSGDGRSGDEGSTLLLTIFYGFLSLVLVLLVVAATSLYLERKRLFSLADGAALVGAEAFELESVGPTAAGLRPELKSADIERAVADFIDGAPGERFEALSIERAATIDGLSATVTLSSYWRPPIVSLLVPEGLRIEVTAVGRSVFR